MRKWLLSAVALFALSLPAQAATLLQVDLSVLNQVTITATTGASSETTSGSDVTGIYLSGIFASLFTDILSPTNISGDLTAFANTSDGTPSLFTSSFNAGTGLNIFSMTDDPELDFISGTQAFSGSGTWSISPEGYTALVNGNIFGDIYAFADTDDDLPGAVVIGQWEVTQIPVPAAVWLFGSALLGLGAMRKKNR